jgi:hypothetical protein
MYRIDDATAATSLPTPEAAGTEGYFTEGNPTAGTPATNIRGSWMNMIQEELRTVVVAGGLTPSKTTYTQVRDAVLALFAKINGDATKAFSVAAATAAAQAVNLGQFASSQSGSGYTKLPNGTIIQWGTYTTVNLQAGNAITFPLAFPNNCFSVSFASGTNNNSLPFGTADSLAAAPSKTGFTVIGVQMTASANNLSAHTGYFIAIGN